jgi:hypothetical protein
MVFDLEKYIDEPLLYDEDRHRMDNEKVFLLGVKIRADLVEMLLNGVKAKDIVVKKLDVSEDMSYGVINMVAASVFEDWGIELSDPLEIGEGPSIYEEEKPAPKMEYGEAKLLKKTINNFKMSDSKNREGAVIRALQDDLDVIRDQLNNELNVFPKPMREMIMMLLLDRLKMWENENWEVDKW